MTPIDSLLAAKKALAASEAAELAKDYYEAWMKAAEAEDYLRVWRGSIGLVMAKQRRERGLADTTEVMAEAGNRLGEPFELQGERYE